MIETVFVMYIEVDEESALIEKQVMAPCLFHDGVTIDQGGRDLTIETVEFNPTTMRQRVFITEHLAAISGLLKDGWQVSLGEEFIQRLLAKQHERAMELVRKMLETDGGDE